MWLTLKTASEVRWLLSSSSHSDWRSSCGAPTTAERGEWARRGGGKGGSSSTHSHGSQCIKMGIGAGSMSESAAESRRQLLCRHRRVDVAVRFWKFMSFAWKVFYCVYNCVYCGCVRVRVCEWVPPGKWMGSSHCVPVPVPSLLPPNSPPP